MAVLDMTVWIGLQEISTWINSSHNHVACRLSSRPPPHDYFLSLPLYTDDAKFYCLPRYRQASPSVSAAPDALTRGRYRHYDALPNYLPHFCHRHPNNLIKLRICWVDYTVFLFTNQLLSFYFAFYTSLTRRWFIKYQ